MERGAALLRDVILSPPMLRTPPPLSRSSSFSSTPRLVGTAALLAAVSACSSAPAPAPSAAPAPSGTAVAAPKREPHAEVLWRHRLGQEGIPQVDHLVTNASGDLLIGAGGNDVALLFRFDATGKPLWRTSVTTFRSWFGGVALDDGDGAYATAWFDTEVTVGNRSISGGAASSIFLLKLDGEGKRAWSTVLGGDGVEYPQLAVSPKGDVLLAGSFITDLEVGTIKLPGGVSASGGHSGNLFVAQLDSSGKARWAREILTSGFFSQMILDGAGDIIVSGDFWGSVAFDPASPMRAEKQSSGDSRNHFLAKLDASGRLRWARHVEAQSIVASPDGSGELHVCALPGSGPPEIKKISADGRVLARLALPDGGPECSSVAVDDQGMIYVAGRKENGPPHPETGDPARMQHVVKMDSTGKVLSSVTLFEDFTMTPALHLLWSKGHLYLAGVNGNYKDPSLYLAELTL